MDIFVFQDFFSRTIIVISRRKGGDNKLKKNDTFTKN